MLLLVWSYIFKERASHQAREYLQKDSVRGGIRLFRAATSPPYLKQHNLTIPHGGGIRQCSSSSTSPHHGTRPGFVIPNLLQQGRPHVMRSVIFVWQIIWSIQSTYMFIFQIQYMFYV